MTLSYPSFTVSWENLRYCLSATRSVQIPSSYVSVSDRSIFPHPLKVGPSPRTNKRNQKKRDPHQ